MQAKHNFSLKQIIGSHSGIEENSVNDQKSEFEGKFKKIAFASLVGRQIENLNLTRKTKHE